jgi:hypothetical protein
VLDINTQKAKRENEVHEYRFFPFKDFEKAVNEMEEIYKSLGGKNKV